MIPYIDFIFHIDKYLAQLIADYGLLVYAILFAIIFIETGFIIMPLLPGDSLLFAAGAFAALGDLNIALIIISLSGAAIIGDNVNYHIGRKTGPKIFHKEHGLFFNKEHLHSTQQFYEKHGAETIIIARFMPIVRTFAPFVAGIGNMDYKKFLLYNIIGAVAWVLLLGLAGYYFGTIPFVQEHFSVVIYAIIFVSFLPLIIKSVLTFIKKYRQSH